MATDEKMICQHCGANIRGMRYSVKETEFGVYYGGGEWESDCNHDIDWPTLVMVCPMCDKVLARTVEEADAILMYVDEDTEDRTEPEA